MQTIFVQVKCELSEAYNVADAAIMDFEEVSEVHSTSGQYDPMLQRYLADYTDIGRCVT